MTQVINAELEALVGLTESEGWKLLAGWIDQEWGAVGFASKVGATLGNPDLDPKLALAQLQQATVAQKAALGIKDWPTRRIAQLKHAHPKPTDAPNLSRRGPGL